MLPTAFLGSIRYLPSEMRQHEGGFAREEKNNAADRIHHDPQAGVLLLLPYSSLTDRLELKAYPVAME